MIFDSTPKERRFESCFVAWSQIADETEDRERGEFLAFRWYYFFCGDNVGTPETKWKFRCMKLEVKIFVTTSVLFQNKVAIIVYKHICSCDG